jgi:hypothetical protein
MAWQDETKAIIEDLLDDLQEQSFSSGSLSEMEGQVKTSLELGLATILKVQDSDERLEALEEGYPIPNKIWSGNFSSGSLTPNSDGGWIPVGGGLADYNILIFVCHEINGASEDNEVHWMPQALYSYFNSTSVMNRLMVASDRMKLYFSDAETMVVGDAGDVEIVEIWGIK